MAVPRPERSQLTRTQPGREKSTFIIRAELSSHGLDGNFERLWVRTDDRKVFELCCVPCSPYRMALGDYVTREERTSRVEVAAASGRGNIRVAFAGKPEVDRFPRPVHGVLAEAGLGIEFNAPGYGAIDPLRQSTSRSLTACSIPSLSRNVLS